MFEQIPVNLIPWLIGAVIMTVVWVKQGFSYFRLRSRLTLALTLTAFFLSISNWLFFLPVLFVDNLYDYTFLYVIGQLFGMVGFFFSAIWMCLMVFSKRWEWVVFLSAYSVVIATFIVYNSFDLLDRGLSIEADGSVNFLSRQQIGAAANAVLLLPLTVIGFTFLVWSRSKKGYQRTRLITNGILLVFITLANIPSALQVADSMATDDLALIKNLAMILFFISMIGALLHRGRRARQLLD